MSTSTVAKRYAQAILDVGVEDKSFEQYGKELRDLASTLASSDELTKVLTNPMHGLPERRALAEGVAVKLGLSGAVTKVFTMLVSGGKVNMAGDIADAYALLEDDIAGRLKATVEGPGEADEATLETIKDKISKETGKDVILDYRQNPELIGGLVVRVGNTILDGSLKSQLERMKEKILLGVV